MAGQLASRPLVVDMVCDVCRIEGFQVEREIDEEDAKGPGHVSIIATRTEGDDKKQVAFECSESDQQIDAREIEAFRSRLRALRITDGVDGRVCDASMYHGELQGIPSTGFFVECLDIEPSTGSLPELPQEMEMKNTVAVASAGVSEDIIKQKVPQVLREDAKVDPESVNVSGISMLHVPIVTVELGGGQIAYKKIVQATTGKVIWDEAGKCSFCDHPSIAVCENCLRTTCNDHKRVCATCKRRVCEECSRVKGVLNKTVLCSSCDK